MFQYRVKVRGTTFLWGGDGISTRFNKDALLMMRVDELGEPVAISTRSEAGANAPASPWGTLKAGEALTINLYGLTGVAAQTANPVDSHVDCMIVPKP